MEKHTGLIAVNDREHQPTVAELDKSFRLPKPDQMIQALSIITSRKLGQSS